MTIKIGYAEGKCSRCGKTHRRRRPVDTAVCDCYKYCPVDHGKGPYNTLMNAYTPDLTPRTYGPIKPGDSDAWGDLEHPIQILYVCPVCNYHSKQTAVEVSLE